MSEEEYEISYELDVLAKLQVFIDQALGVRTSNQGNQNTCASDIDLKDIKIPVTNHARITWLLKMALVDDEDYRVLANFLRRTETYSLVSFLYQKGNDGEKLNVLSGKYGVSSSHFRRLCRTALGGSVKSELRDWRLAKAILDVIENRHSLTRVAMEHGYASPSHFSTEAKQILGVSPSHLLGSYDVTYEKKELM